MPDLKIYRTSEDERFEVYALNVTNSLYSDPRDVLRQRVLKAIMSEDNTDAFYNLSTGVDQLAGSNVAKSRLAGEILSRIRSTEERIIQAQLESEPLESRLDSINILGIESDSVDSVRVMIEIINQLGDVINAEVVN